MTKIKTKLSNYLGRYLSYMAFELLIAWVAYIWMKPDGDGMVGFFCACILSNVFGFLGFRAMNRRLATGRELRKLQMERKKWEKEDRDAQFYFTFGHGKS